MNPEETRNLQAEDTSMTEQEMTALPEPKSAEETLSASPRVEPSEAGEARGEELEFSPEGTKVPALTVAELSEAADVGEIRPEPDEVLLPSVDPEPEPTASTSLITAETARVQKAKGSFREQPPQMVEVAPNVLRRWTRRDVLLFGAGAIAALAGGGSLLPQATLERLGVIHGNKTWPGKEWFLNRALRIDDDVAEALYSQNRLVPTYSKSQITPLKNNYNGATPDTGYISEWHLTLEGLASGLTVSLNIRNLHTRFQVHEEVTRLVCVEGWSAVAWWSLAPSPDCQASSGALEYPRCRRAIWAGPLEFRRSRSIRCRDGGPVQLSGKQQVTDRSHIMTAER